MSTFISGILLARGLDKIPAPLWKLKLTDIEYEELKLSLINEFNKEGNQKKFDSCPQEAALFYAEWWKRNNGVEENDPFFSLGVGIDEEAAHNLLENAKRIFNPNDTTAYIPGAKLVRSKRGREFEYSLYYQGGFPMGRVCARKRNGKTWDSFIQKFIQNNIDFEDMHSAVIARKTLRECKNVLVNAGREHKPEGMPFACNEHHEWYLKVINDITKLDEKRELRPFHIKWHYKRNPFDFSIECNVLGPSILSPSFISQHKELEAFDSIPVQLFVGDEQISTLIEYQKATSKDGIFFLSHCDINHRFDYDGYSKISLRIPGVDKPLIIADADMNTPRSFFWTSGENYEMGSKIGERASVIVFSNNWTLEKTLGNYISIPCEFNGTPYTIISIFDSDDYLEFLLRNNITGESQKFSSEDSPAWVEVKILKKYSDYVVDDLIDFSDPEQYQVLFLKSDDEDGKIASIDKVVFRSDKNMHWDNNIRHGKVDCTVKSAGEYFTSANGLFSVGPNFKVENVRSFYDKNECHYRVSWDKGDVFPDGANIKPTQDGLWIFKKDDYENVIPFRCVPYDKKEQAFTIRIKAIYKDFVIFSPNGEKLKRYETIPWDDINSYRYRVNGETSLTVSRKNKSSYQVPIVSGYGSISGVPEEGPLGLLIKPNILAECEWRANDGYDFRIRYCDFTLKRYPIILTYDKGSNVLVPMLSIKEDINYSYPDSWIANQKRIVTTFKGHLYIIDMDGNIIHDISRDDDGTYHLPNISEKVFIVCNQRGYLRPFIFENGEKFPVAALTNGEDSFKNVKLDDTNWERATKFLDTGLRYGIPLQTLPWVSTIIKNPAYILALYVRLIILSEGNPLKLYEAKSKMSAAMAAGQINIADFCEDSMSYLFISCPQGIYNNEYQQWLTMYGYNSSSEQTWQEFVTWAAGKAQNLIMN